MAQPKETNIMRHGLFALGGATFGVLAGYGTGLVVSVVAAASTATTLIGQTPASLLGTLTIIGLGLGLLGGAIMSYMLD